MKILFLIQGNDQPSSRYRVLQYLPYLKQQGVKTTVSIYPHDIRGVRTIYQEIGSYDVVFLQRKRPHALTLHFLLQRAKKLVYDFDDAVMYRSANASSPYSAARERQFARIVKAVDHVIAGNTFLGEQARRYTNHVTVIPTAIDLKKYTPKSYAKKKKKITLGWIGSSSTLPYLEHIKGVFEELGRRYNHIELKVICNSFFDGEKIPVIKKVWSAKEEIADLKSLDIGMMPLTDDLWSRGKCGLKILQYCGVGIPVVCTPVGVNRDIVQDGINGFWAMTEEEWVEKLSLLIEDSELRRKMGLYGRKIVGDSYSIQACVPKFCRVLEAVVQEPR